MRVLTIILGTAFLVLVIGGMMFGPPPGSTDLGFWLSVGIAGIVFAMILAVDIDNSKNS